MRSQLLFGEYKPDFADHAHDGLVLADGVYAAPNGYKPVKAFQEIAAALSGTFMGAGAFVAPDGTARLIAGDSTDLYRLASGAWTSMLGSLTVNARWQFTQFGDDVVAVYGGAPVKVDLVAGTAAALTGSPPTASSCATVRDFVVLGRAAGVTNVVQWSQQGNCEAWSVGTNMAGAQPLYDGGSVMGITSGEYGLILQRYAVKRMAFTGDPNDPFQFDQISTNYGCKAEGSIIQADRRTFFYSDRGFAMCDGASVVPIGAERVNNTFRSLYSDNEIAAMWGCADPVRDLAIWIMPNRLWMYNWTLDRWTVASVDAQACFPAFTSAVSIDELDAIYGDLDSIPYSLDDPRFSGGEPRLTVVKGDGTFGTLSGDPVEAVLQMAWLEPAANRTTRLQRVRPLTDAGSGVSLRVYARQSLGGAQSETLFNELNDRGDMPCRMAAREMKLQLAIAAGAEWSHVRGLEIEYAAGGRR